ncbi:hypothetical protein BC332_08443 [Capsicum chinense]|nr:hypothetical protein BC332_08443 [Capsicum chinense]
MDNPQSFSLGITQLDATVEDISLGFVPATFDEQDPDWAENRSKHRNDPITMKKLRDKATSKSKKSTSKASKKKFDDSGRPRLQNVFIMSVQGEILKFTMLEFAIITGLKCTDNIDDYMYTSSSKSALMSRYFSDNKGAIARSKLITRVQMKNFDNTEDALNLAILFFVHTFMFSQHKKEPISVAHFQIIEDGWYIHFPWAKVTFEKLMSSWQQDFTTAKQLYSLGEVPHVLNVWMFECCSKHSYKNIQPTTDEVSRLDLSFSKDFETCYPTTYASTFDFRKLKRTSVELEQCVGTIAEEFGDFSTIPPQKILIKAGFTSPVSPDQPLKKRKTVMFEQDNQAVMEDDTSGRGHAIHHGSDLYCETHKDSTDKGEIDYDKGSLNDMEVSRDEESNKQHILEEQQLLDVNAADKEAGREDDFENEDCSDLQALEDVDLTAKEYVNEVNLKNQEYTNVIDVQDEFGGTITDSIQAFVDTILFVLSTPSTTKSLDVSALNKMTERHWDLPDSQILPDFPDAQVQELQASKAKAPAKRERKKVQGFKVTIHFKLGDNYRYTTTSCFFKTYVEKTHTYYPTKSAVELSTQQDYAESIVVAKNEDAIANIIHGFCMPTGLPWYMIDEVYVPINCGKIFYWILAVIVLKERLIRVYDSLSSKRKKEPPIEIQKFIVMLPTYLSYNDFYDKTERTDRPSLEAYKGKITQQIGLANEISFDVDYVQNIPQQVSDSLDCDVFVCAYAKILSEGLQVHSCGFDGASQRARYASLLWHYGVEKTNEGYTSDNGDPPRPRKSVIEEIDASAIVTLE